MQANVPMSYALTTLWHERQRFLPGILAVAFSALLVALQCGLLLGIFTFASLPIDHSTAEIWMGGLNIQSVDLGERIPESYQSRLTEQPEVVSCETYIEDASNWVRPDGGIEPCMIVGTRLGNEALARHARIDAGDPRLLTEPSSVVVDESELERLGIQGPGDFGQIGDHKVRRGGSGPRLPGRRRGVRLLFSRDGASLDAPQTASDRLFSRQMSKIPSKPRQSSRGGLPIRSFPYIQNEEFSLRSRLYWLTKTKSGVAMGYAAALGLLVGAAVTSQTLYAATAASLPRIRGALGPGHPAAAYGDSSGDPIALGRRAGCFGLSACHVRPGAPGRSDGRRHSASRVAPGHHRGHHVDDGTPGWPDGPSAAAAPRAGHAVAINPRGQRQN